MYLFQGSPYMSRVNINLDFQESLFYISFNGSHLNKIPLTLKNISSGGREFSHLDDLKYFSRKRIYCDIKPYP